MPNPRKVRGPLLLMLLLGAGLGGCGKDTPVPTTAHAPAGHTHTARHGGVAVELGAEEFHVEFTHGDAPGVLLAYFMDAEMEDYVRIAAPTFAATARVDGRDVPLVFRATASTATGETVGDTALFSATADALTARPAVTLTVPTLTVKGRTYPAITAELPAGKKP